MQHVTQAILTLVLIVFAAGPLASHAIEPVAPPWPLIQNGDFSRLNPQGQPEQWSCLCYRANVSCSVERGQSPKGRNAYVIPPACRAVAAVDVAKRDAGLRFELYTNDSEANRRSFSLLSLGVDVQDTGYARPLPPATNQWVAVQSEVVSTEATMGRASLVLRNLGTRDLKVGDVRVFQDIPNPVRKAGSILKATHHTELKYLPGQEPVRLWFPLPLDYATQVPLSLDFRVAPSSVVKHISYVSDQYGNWGAYVDLQEDQATDRLTVHWESLVLSKRISEDERPSTYRAEQDTDLWLASTPVVNSESRDIATTARTVVSPGASAFSKMMAVLAWTKNNLHPGDVSQGLDAVTVFRTRNASCTGYANAAAAFGRALGIPTRVLANLYVGAPQATHYVDEFYLGDDLGWRRVEPQKVAPFLPEDYSIALRFVLPEDEQQRAFARPGESVIPGVPWKSVTERITGRARIQSAFFEPSFADCPFCNNKAEVQATLRGNPARMKHLFGLARKTWRRDLGRFLSGSIDRETLEKRALVHSVDNLDSLDRFLKSLVWDSPIGNGSQSK